MTSNNPKPEELVEIRLGGESYRLFLPAKEMKRLREEHGIDLLKGEVDKMTEEPLEALQVVLAASLCHQDPEIGSKMDDLVHIGNVKYCWDKIREMMGGEADESLPKPEPVTASTG